MKVHICATCWWKANCASSGRWNARRERRKNRRGDRRSGHASLRRFNHRAKAAAVEADLGLVRAQRELRSKLMPSFSSTRIDAALPSDTTPITRRRPNLRAHVAAWLAPLRARNPAPRTPAVRHNPHPHPEIVAPEQSAHADRGAVGFPGHVPEPEAVFLVHRPGTFTQIATGIFATADPAICDVGDKGWLIEQADEKVRVVRDQASQHQPRRFQLRRDRQNANARNSEGRRQISPSRCRR